MYDQHQEHYSGTSAMDITKLCPGIKKQRISIKANAGDVLVFNSLLPHGPSDNLSSQVQMKCYPNLAPLNYLANPQAEVLATYTNGAHPKNYYICFFILHICTLFYVCVSQIDKKAKNSKILDS